jgi:predicted short-subunit dehydrogenase-like oxidoreductase (DUF2520 family)
VFERVRVIGRGRVGSALASRLAERGLTLDDRDPELVVICIPDRAIADAAADIAPGPWMTHVSGATSLAALAPHTRRFGLHPLQTFTRSRGAEQLDGAWAALTAESPEAESRAAWLAATLGLRSFVIADSDRVIYHAGAVVASNYLVTIYRAASRLLAAAGAPAEALVPLMRQTIANNFELTGPIERGDTATVEAHMAEITRRAPELAEMYRALAAITAP